MKSLEVYFKRVWRYRWMVLIVTVVATVGAVLYTVRQPITYTARSTLTTATENRSPDQDAYLAQGYAQYFNEESYQKRIAAIAQVPDGVTFLARAGATSPILYIEVAATDPSVASTMAPQLAEHFRNDVQAQANASRDQAIASLNQQVDEKRARLAELEGQSDERALIISEISDLQRRATDLQDDTTNQLIELQREAGVSAEEPSPILNGLLGFAGGLALGCAAALGLAAVRDRITSPEEVRDRLGLSTLGVVNGHRRRDDQARAQRLESLAAAVSLSDLPRPATLAITSPRRTSLNTQVAEGIVYYQALQGTRTLLVRADLRNGASESQSNGATGATGATVASLLTGVTPRPPAPTEIAIGAARMLVLPAGAPLIYDPYALFAPARFDAMLRNLNGLADLIVIEAPPVNDAAESQIICAAVDRTVLVVEEGVTRADDASHARDVLTQVGASVLGAVIGRATPHGDHSEPFATLPVVDLVRRPLPTRSSYSTLPVRELVIEGDDASPDRAKTNKQPPSEAE
jgi:polysaccharide biosynthesis transport protein